MRRSNYKKHLATFLSFIFVLSLTGCGKKDTVVDDYGSGSTDSSSSSTDAAYAKGDGQTLQSKFGDWAKWNEDFAIQGVPTSVNTSIPIPDSEYLNVYKQRSVTQGQEDEDKIVKNLFGNSAKKLEEIKYTNETDYITFLHKYREIYHEIQGDIYDYFSDANVYRNIMGAIDSSCEDVYKWIDEDNNYYIHMYEGKYNGIRYGLIYAFDYNSGRKYIFFDPISISEVFPGSDYKTVVYEGNGDTLEKTQDIKNECTLTKDEVKQQAKDFLEDNLGIAEIDNNITEDSEMFHLSVGLSTYALIDDKSMTRLAFSNTDYYTTLQSTKVQSARGISRVAAQEEKIADKMEKNNDDYFETLYANTANGTNDTKLTRNGYAVYLEDPSSSLVKSSDNIIISTDNVGMIKVTDKGIYGVDIVMMSETEDVIENVELLDFEKIQESLKNALEEKLDLKKMGDPKELTINGGALLYDAYYEDGNTSEYSKIPVWQFNVNGDNVNVNEDGVSGVVSVSINAMDGSVCSMDDSIGFYYEGNGTGEESVEVSDGENED